MMTAEQIRARIEADLELTKRKVEFHLAEFRHDFDTVSNKIWAVKDAELSSRARTLEILLRQIDLG
jgi:hypothetical protein